MMKSEPKDEEMPVEFGDLPSHIQEAVQIFNYLPDRIDSMSGTYFGKDFASLPILMNIFSIEESYELFTMLKIAESVVVELYQKQTAARKAQQKAQQKR